MESDDAKRSSRRGHEENRAMMSRGRERAVQAAKMLKPTSPWFMTIFRPYHIRDQRRLVSLASFLILLA
jgi:hypothetical protein